MFQVLHVPLEVKPILPLTLAINELGTVEVLPLQTYSTPPVTLKDDSLPLPPPKAISPPPLIL